MINLVFKTLWLPSSSNLSMLIQTLTCLGKSKSVSQPPSTFYTFYKMPRKFTSTELEYSYMYYAGLAAKKLLRSQHFLNETWTWIDLMLSDFYSCIIAKTVSFYSKQQHVFNTKHYEKFSTTRWFFYSAHISTNILLCCLCCKTYCTWEGKLFFNLFEFRSNPLLTQIGWLCCRSYRVSSAHLHTFTKDNFMMFW